MPNGIEPSNSTTRENLTPSDELHTLRVGPLHEAYTEIYFVRGMGYNNE
jgi:hypothetical protein